VSTLRLLANPRLLVPEKDSYINYMQFSVTGPITGCNCNVTQAQLQLDYSYGARLHVIRLSVTVIRGPIENGINVKRLYRYKVRDFKRSAARSG
jgi:hypothetical protein